MLIEVASVVFQLSTAFCPAVMLGGLAVNCIVGAGVDDGDGAGGVPVVPELGPGVELVGDVDVVCEALGVVFVLASWFEPPQPVMIAATKSTTRKDDRRRKLTSGPPGARAKRGTAGSLFIGRRAERL